MTAQGHPRRIFATAIERGNIVMAEATARELELGRISLEEALALTALVAEKEPERRSRFAVRWLRRLLEEDVTLTIEEAVVTGSCLSALEAVVISNDSDLVTPIKLVREELKLPVGIVNPRGRPSWELRQVSTFHRKIRQEHLEASQFPDTLEDANGTITKPAAW